MKNYKILRYLNLGSFPGFIQFSSGYSYDELIETVSNWTKKSKDQDSKLWIDAMVHMKEKFKNDNITIKVTLENLKKKQERKFVFIYFREKIERTDYWNIKLAHECLHVCQFVLPDYLEREREIEAECYLHSHLMQQVYDFMK